MDVNLIYVIILLLNGVDDGNVTELFRNEINPPTEHSSSPTWAVIVVVVGGDRARTDQLKSCFGILLLVEETCGSLDLFPSS